MFLYKNFFFNIFYSFNPNHAYWNQRRLFSGNLPGMFFVEKDEIVSLGLVQDQCYKTAAELLV